MNPRPRTKKRRILRRAATTVVVLALVGGGAVAFRAFHPDSQAATAPAAVLRTVAIETGTLAVDESVDGSVVLAATTTVRQRIEGQLASSSANSSSPNANAVTPTSGNGTNAGPATADVTDELADPCPADPTTVPTTTVPTALPDDSTTTTVDPSSTTSTTTTSTTTTSTTTTVPGTSTTSTTTTVPATSTTSTTTTVPATTAPPTTVAPDDSSTTSTDLPPTTTVAPVCVPTTAPSVPTPDTSAPTDQPTSGARPSGGSGGFGTGGSTSGQTSGGSTTGQSGTQTRTTQKVTSTSAAGATVAPGDVLYTVDGSPVVMLIGSLPAWRTISVDADDGADIEQLEYSLVALGYSPVAGVTVDGHWDATTTAMVEAWQTGLGQPATGIVSLGSVVFMPSSATVSTVTAAVGDDVGEGDTILTLAAPTQEVVIDVPTELQSTVAAGLVVDLAGTPGTVSLLRTVERNGAIVVQAVIAPSAPLTDQVNGSTISVDIGGSDQEAADVLMVPAEALASRLDGSYAVQIDHGDGTSSWTTVTLLGVEGSKVAISGADLQVGPNVLLPV